MRASFAFLARRRRSPKPRNQHDGSLRPIPWLPVAVAIVVGLLGLAVLSLWWLTGDFGGLPSRKGEDAKLRLETIRTALAIAAGAGALAALLLALRKQSIRERKRMFIERDAQERRITELYVAAVGQLDSGKAAVRLGGLYALERLGNDNPHLRQAVVNVICAYLRMPFTPPAAILRSNAEKSPHYLPHDADIPEPELQRERREELQVRLTAQHLLETHLRAPADAEEPDTYWRDADGQHMHLDLTDATLIKFSFADCQLGSVRFDQAQFYGSADLEGAQFHGRADLDEAQFHGEAHLHGAQFHGDADLRWAQFYGTAELDLAKFHGGMNLFDARFHGYANLYAVDVHDYANLDKAQFHDNARLEEAQFHGRAFLRWAQFHDHLDLRRAQFHGRTVLREAQFHGRTNLEGAQFYGPIEVEEVAGPGLDFARALVKSPKQLPHAWKAVSPGGNGLWQIARRDELQKDQS